MTDQHQDQQLDYVIVGQGIAGTTLAWLLGWRGLQGLIVDCGDHQSASKVAAGLMTPVTGQRLVPAWRLDECWSAAERFYRRVESETGSQFLTQPGQVRLFESQESQDNFQRRDWSSHPVEIRQTHEPVDQNAFNVTFGSFELPTAGRLDVAEYISASLTRFVEDHRFRAVDPESTGGIEIIEGKARLPKLNVQAKRVIFCQGASGADNPWFSDVEFKSARGEILTLRIDGLSETRIVNQGVWLIPCGNGLFKAGSTYDFENLHAGSTESGRDEILNRLRSFLKLPVDVVSHESGVRPIVTERRPVIGVHREFPQLAILNGLGSKGSLLAPWVAGQLVDHLINGTSIPSELDYQTRFTKRSPETRKPPLRLTTQAQQIVAEVVKPGEPVIDATAGNGHDTCFLAKATGENGPVFAFDVQADALRRTAARLADIGCTNVTLLHRSHSDMKKVIPENHHGAVAAAMFNLGYLPGGDHSVTTETESSLPALRHALELIRPGGVVTVLAYPGHVGGADETGAVRRLIDGLPDSQFEKSIRRSDTTKETAPLLLIVVRR